MKSIGKEKMMENRVLLSNFYFLFLKKDSETIKSKRGNERKNNT